MNSLVLTDAFEGARHTAQTISCLDDDDNIIDLTGATISARIEDRETGIKRASDGTFALVAGGATGKFNWTYGAVDVGTLGAYWVQFKATYGGAATFDLGYEHAWRVRRAI